MTKIGIHFVVYATLTSLSTSARVSFMCLVEDGSSRNSGVL